MKWIIAWMQEKFDLNGVNVETFRAHTGNSLSVYLLSFTRTSLVLVSMPFDGVLFASPPASGYGAILKSAAAHTPGLPAASLVCLTFCQHHVNEGPVSVHCSHTGVPFNEFAI